MRIQPGDYVLIPSAPRACTVKAAAGGTVLATDGDTEYVRPASQVTLVPQEEPSPGKWKKIDPGDRARREASMRTNKKYYQPAVQPAISSK